MSVISLSAGQHDVAGTTNPSGGAFFRSLAYDAATGQLVMRDPAGSTLYAFDPFTAGNLDTNYRPGSANDSFSGGLDVDGANTWFSPDLGNIYKNGVLFADHTNTAQTLQKADGLLVSPALAEQQWGWSGTEQVGNNLWAVAVLTNDDTGRSRTIVWFDANTGELLGFDPDGDPVAARWEDLAFDGRYLYAADLRGNFDGSGSISDIYVSTLPEEFYSRCRNRQVCWYWALAGPGWGCGEGESLKAYRNENGFGILRRSRGWRGRKTARPFVLRAVF